MSAPALSRTGSEKSNLGTTTILLFALALVGGVYQFTHAGFYLGPGHEMTALGRNLAERGVFADPFPDLKTGPTANQPPLYPLYLALLIRLVGMKDGLVVALLAATIAVQAIHAALMPRLSLLLYGEARAGIYAGVLSALAFRLEPEWDVAYTTLGLVVFCLFSARLWDSPTNRALAGAIAGALAGALMLLNPVSILVSLPWLIFLLLGGTGIPACVERLCHRPVVRFSAAFVLALGAAILPWMIRNRVQVGGFVLKDTFGFTFYASNNPCAESSLQGSLQNGCHDAHNPNGNLREAQELARIGEIEYDRRTTAAALRWIAGNPRRFAALTGQRIFEFWFPARVPALHCIYGVWLATALSIPGLILAARKRMPVAWFTIAISLVYPLIYYVVVSDSRYRYPILWVSLLCAGYALSRAQALLSSRH